MRFTGLQQNENILPQTFFFFLTNRSPSGGESYLFALLLSNEFRTGFFLLQRTEKTDVTK